MAVLPKTANFLVENSAEYATYMTTELGAEILVAQTSVLPLAVQMLRDIEGRTVSIRGTVLQRRQKGQNYMVLK
jgi:hypothetical protein